MRRATRTRKYEPSSTGRRMKLSDLPVRRVSPLERQLREALSAAAPTDKEPRAWKTPAPRPQQVQCWRCGKWLKRAGVKNHERHCIERRRQADIRKRAR